MTKHILYLASGSSRRFGENKLLYPLDGKPIYLFGLEMLSKYVEKHEDCTLTVISCCAEIRQEAVKRGARAVDSPQSAKGISYTIKAGLDDLRSQLSENQRALKRQTKDALIVGVDEKKTTGKDFVIKDGTVPEEDFMVFVVADQPYLSVASVEKLLACAKEGTETASMCYGGRPGNPTLFSAKLIPELMALEGDTGGRAVIKKHSCIYVQAESEAELWDIDTKEDLF